MNHILELAVGEQIDERVRKLRRMFAFDRPVPRMTLKKLAPFARQMLPGLAASLFRSLHVPNSVRDDLGQEGFFERFRASAGVAPNDRNDVAVSCEGFCRSSPAYAMVLNRACQFGHFGGLVQRMLAAQAPSKPEDVRILVSEIRHEAFQLLEAKVIFGSVLYSQGYRRLLQGQPPRLVHVHEAGGGFREPPLQEARADSIFGKYHLNANGSDAEAQYRVKQNCGRSKYSEVSADESKCYIQGNEAAGLKDSEDVCSCHCFAYPNDSAKRFF
jgi:hypothetical protein